MSAPLVKIQYPSIYPVGKTTKVNLPDKMGRCCPDTKLAIFGIQAELKKLGGKLILSDLFRSYDMQLQSHNDYVTGKKKAFSPAPGGSLHESGRAFDMDLGSMKVTLKKFWEVALAFGFYPIIDKPTASAKEAWHFDCRGSHQLVYEYYKSGKADKKMGPYEAMAASSILSIGVHVDKFGTQQQNAFIQSGLIRLGQNIGSIDGDIGKKSKAALATLGLAFGQSTAEDVENLLKQKFPKEYTLSAGDVLAGK